MTREQKQQEWIKQVCHWLDHQAAESARFSLQCETAFADAPQLAERLRRFYSDYGSCCKDLANSGRATL
jgi:hypothetical protein